MYIHCDSNKIFKVSSFVFCDVISLNESRVYSTVFYIHERKNVDGQKIQLDSFTRLRPTNELMQYYWQ